MKSEQILEVLSKLDPTNKDHWTQDGQPRLGAVGEGVTRQQILDVAPLFSRSNAVVDVPSEEEVQATLEEELLAIELEREAAQTALVTARRAAKDAEKAAKDAEAKLESLREQERNRDQRSPTEANMDYLRHELQERLKRAGAQDQANALLRQHGLSSFQKGLTASPIDQAIAQRIIRERKQRANG